MNWKAYAKAKGRSFAGNSGGIHLDEKEWNRFLNLLEVFGQSPTRGEILRLTRKTIRPVMLQAQKEVARIEAGPNYQGDGNLYDSIGMITGRSRSFVNVQIGARIKKSFQGYHAFMVEHGTEIRSNSKGQNRGAATANPFMRPAFDKTLPMIKGQFEKNVAVYIQKKADKVFGK